MFKNKGASLKLVVWCLIIFSFSSIPSAKISDTNYIDFVIRKTAHISEFFILYILSYFAFNKNHKWALLFSIAYAASDEYHQSFTPGRGPSPKDVLIDTIGIILGYIFIWKGYFAKINPRIQKLLS
jgi:VanZ family protein